MFKQFLGSIVLYSAVIIAVTGLFAWAVMPGAIDLGNEFIGQRITPKLSLENTILIGAFVTGLGLVAQAFEKGKKKEVRQ